jgi:diguanylate cyclase (GGDEF)-like protein
MGIDRVPNRPISRRQWTLVAGGALGAYLLAYILALVMLQGPLRARLVDLMAIVPPFAVAVLCGVAASRASTGRVRWFWALFAVAHVFWGFGEVARADYELVLHVVAPYPSVADVGWLAYYAFAFAGLLLLASFRGRGRTTGSTLLLDVFLFAATAGALCWELIITPGYESGASLLANLTNVSYSSGNVLILVGLVSILLNSGRALRPRGLIWLSGCLVIWLVAHTAFAVLSSNSAHESGSWLDSFGLLGSMFAGVGALVFIRAAGQERASVATDPHSRRSKKAVELLRMTIPYVAVPSIAALLCVRFIIRDGGWVGDLATVGLALLLTGMMLFRQWLVVIETRKLQASLTSLSQELEVRVVERTAELATEKEHLAMLNLVAEQMSQCLTARDVIDSGLRLVCEPAGCTRSGIWLTGPGQRGRFYGDGGLSRAGRQQLLAVLEKSELAAKVLAKGEMAHIDGPELRACAADDRLEEVFHSLVLLPLISRRAILGMLCLGFEDPAHIPSEEGISLAYGVASQIAVALENARRYDDARRLAERDPVTELLNSRGLARSLDRELSRSRRTGRPFSVVMMDLDNFKLFNDVYGHAVGDQALRQVAGVLKKVLRRSDIIGRQGGDEFLAILPETAAASAIECVNHIQKALGTMGFRTDGQHAIPLSMSCGISAFPYDGRRMGELLAVADANVYRSKQKGGDCATPSVGEERDEEPAAGVFTVLEGLVVAVDNKDHYTRQHSDDVTRYALALADRLGLSSETVHPLRIAGVLHDVGKIGIPDHILRKPGPLDPEEFEAIKQHVSLGELMIKAIPDLNDVLAAVGAHHERWNGGGYPRGLAGEDIPLLGRILAVADAYSAMTTDRPYRKALSVAEAREEMRRVAGIQLDSYLVDMFLGILDEWGSALESEQESRDEDFAAGAVAASAA